MDVSVFVTSRPTDLVPSTPPDIVVEIVSPDERYPRLLEKLEEYRRWGVPHIWVVEPQMQRFQVYADGSLTSVEKFEVSERGFALSVSELFDYVSARRTPA